jgi:hypothetical protein
MDEADTELEQGGVSRRDALKRMAVTAAGFWAVPVISSFRTPALAQTVSEGCLSGRDPCIEQGDCSPPGGFCTCLRTVEGGTFCHQPSFCADLEDCTSTSDCREGFACAFSCCDTLKCIPPCGTVVSQGIGIAAAGDGRMTVPSAR